MERSRVVLLAALIALAFPGGAYAATVSAPEVEQYDGEIEATATFEAEPGEANDVTVTATTSPLVVTYEDPNAPITTGDNCESLGEHAARCSGPITLLDTRLADGDDTVHMVVEDGGFPLFSRASGGGGDDRLFGSAGFEVLGGDAGDDTIDGGGGDDLIDGGTDADELNGDDGKDAIDGGPGEDDLDGGGGDDKLHGDGENDAPGTDTIDGGPGEDLASYYLQTGPIDVDLATGTERGPDGEADVLSGIEDVEGGLGGGRIAGDAGPNELSAGLPDAPVTLNGRGGDDTLTGGPEDDLLSGGYGNDVLTGWGGSDSFHAGAGADELRTLSPAGGAGADRAISCGPDADMVTTADPNDLIPRSCEHVRFGGGFLFSPILQRAQGPTILIDLVRPRSTHPCRAVIGLYGPAPADVREPRKIAFHTFTVRRNRFRATLEPNAYGRRLLRAHRHLRIQVLVETLRGCDETWPAYPRPGSGFTARL